MVATTLPAFPPAESRLENIQVLALPTCSVAELTIAKLLTVKTLIDFLMKRLGDLPYWEVG